MSLTEELKVPAAPSRSSASRFIRIPRRGLIALGLIAAAFGGFWVWKTIDKPRNDTQPDHQTVVLASADTQPPAKSLQEGRVHLSADRQKAIGLKTAVVGSGSTRHVVTAPGRVTPNETQFAYITPRAPGVVRSVTAHLGQEVKAGDLLATIDSPIVGDARLDLYTRLQTLEIASAQAEWQSTIYKNTLELVEALRNQEPQQKIQETFAGRPVGENRERLLSAYAQYRLAQATIDRNRELFAQKLITSKQFQQVTAEYEVAQATYQSLMDQMGFEVRLANIRAQQSRKQAETAVRAAQERLRILGVKPDGTEPEIDHGKVRGVNPDGTLVAPETGAAPLSEKPETVIPESKERATVAVGPVGSPGDLTTPTLDAPVSRFSIWSPFDGTILDRQMIVPGVAVEATKSLFTLANLSSVYVEASIHEQDFEALIRSQGGAIRFHSPAYPSRFFQGEVIYSGDLVDEATRTVKLLARAENPERLLKPGMYVTVEILSAGATSMIRVPTSGVLTQANRSFVFVQTSPEVFERKDIEIASIRDEFALVSNGLSPSDVVVVEGAFKLKGIAAHGTQSDH